MRKMDSQWVEPLTRYQKYLLEMLLVFDAFCKEHGLPYFLAGGSALGAYRHQGFIPWDDDIDLAMMRPDFERLEQLLAKHDNRLEKYRYSPVEKQIIPDAPIGHLLYLPQGDYPQNAAPKLDIHPIDGVPDGKAGRTLQRIFVIVHYLSIYRLPTKNKGKAAHEISRIIVKITPDRLFNWYARVSKKIITAKKTRELAVSGLAKGMKLQNDAKATFQNMKDEAQDICCDAKEKAGIDNEVDEEVDA